MVFTIGAVILALMVIAPVQSFAKVTAPDTVIVPEGAQIYDFIMGDTTSTGARNVPGRVYKLERGKMYIFTETMEINFDFTLIADDDDPSNPVRPPMLVRGVHPDGSLVDQLFNLTGDNIQVKFKNILFQGVPMDGVYRNDWALGLSGSGTDVRLIFDKCVFNGWTYAATDLPMENIKLYVTDCIFRNMVQPVHPFGGQVIATYNAVDTLLYTNNTFFNCSSYIILPDPEKYCNYLRFDHNTIFTTMVNPFWTPTLHNAEFTNNIIYGALALGQRQQEIEAGWFGWDGVAAGIMNYDTMSVDQRNELGITEADRRIVHKNNAWYEPQEIKDFWAAYPDSVPVVNSSGDTTGWTVQPLTPTVWMNANTQAMFNDASSYPNFADVNTMNVEPGFDTTTANPVVDSVVAWAEWWRTGLGWDSPNGPPRQYDPTGAGFFNLPWPLPEDLTYSNTTLLTAGTDGFPLGDLNWYPDKRKQWGETTGVESMGNSLPSKYILAQNYPNPFNPTTTINFRIPISGNTKLTVYNVLGQKVATLVDRYLTAGSYKYQFDASNLPSGVYFYRLQSKNYSQVKKMMLLK